MYYILQKAYENGMERPAPRRDTMKTLGYIYVTILKAMSGEISVEHALELIKAVLAP